MLFTLGAIILIVLFLATDVFDDDGTVTTRVVVITNEPTITPANAPSGPSLRTPQPVTLPSPTANPPAPTIPTPPTTPTPAPTPIPEWLQVGSPLTMPDALTTNYGHSVAILDEFLVVGEPLANSNEGDIAIYERSTNFGLMADSFELDTRQFGFSLDAASINSVPTIVVGAIATTDETGLVEFGSAHVYQLDQGAWTQIGGAIRPSLVPAEAFGQFGFAVAIAGDNPTRVAVGAGAALVNGNDDAGKLYTFELVGGNWELMAEPFTGNLQNKGVGQAVDLSQDASRLLVGAPGDRQGDGSISYYEWTGSEWKRILPLPGSGNEALGASVSIISADGKTIAFGAPGAGDNNQGAVRIFQESTFIPLFFDGLGQDIVGAPGERIGTTLSGAMNRVALGTDTGSFHVYEYDGQSWIEVPPMGGTPTLGSRVVSIHITEDANTVVVGLENRQVQVFDLM